MNEPTAFCTVLIILVTCVVSFVQFQNRAVEEKYIFNPYSILAHKEYYRLVTSAFLHADWNHLIMNMLTLYLFGRRLELYLGPAHFLVLYFGAIAGGSLLALYVHRHHEYRAYGASGGVCGLVFAYILLFPGSGVGMYFLPISVPGWLYAISYMLYSFFGMKEHRGDVGHDAHLGGAIIGLLIAAALNPPSVQYNLTVFLIVLIGAVALLVYLWLNPHFLPMAAFFNQPRKWRTKDTTLPKHKRENLQVDAILEKIAKRGVDSLTANEKALLDEVAGKYQRRADSKKPESGLSI